MRHTLFAKISKSLLIYVRKAFDKPVNLTYETLVMRHETEKESYFAFKEPPLPWNNWFSSWMSENTDSPDINVGNEQAA
jgi:hypothetical protein